MGYGGMGDEGDEGEFMQYKYMERNKKRTRACVSTIILLSLYIYLDRKERREEEGWTYLYHSSGSYRISLSYH